MPIEYGIRPYANMVNENNEETPYIDTMKAPTWAYALAQEVQKFSEFMKPYLADGDYPDMENNWPGYSFPQPDGGIDTGNYTPGNLGCAVTCNAPLYCNGNVECHASRFNCPPGMGPAECKQNFQFAVTVNGARYTAWRYYSSTLQTLTNPETGATFLGSVPNTNVFPLQIRPPLSGSWAAQPNMDVVSVLMLDPVGNRCSTKLPVFCRNVDCCVAPGYIAMTFDDASTPDTIARSGSISCYVLNGCPPYTWSVTGTGFTFTESSTTVLSNTLNASGSACGSGTCTVTDNCGTVVTFYILCTTGVWTTTVQCALTGANFSSSCGYAGCMTGSPIVSYLDNYRWTITHLNVCLVGYTAGYWAGASCSVQPSCGNPAACNANGCVCGATSGECVANSANRATWSCA